MTKKVAVAMSGGVDSSVAAGLLVSQGYDVIGIMLRLWSVEGQEECNRCCTPDSVMVARRIAAKLGIPFYVIDAKDIFYEHVVKDFIRGYQQGITPNPCIRCNRYIRWGFMLDHILGMGCDWMATGHYAQLGESDDGKITLLEGNDPRKDQSYVLSMLRQDQLAHSIFPVGGYEKTRVREIAREMDFPVADKPDSQDLCFLGEQDYRSFLRTYGGMENQPGEIVTQDGKVIGHHQGLLDYTIGQRKGMRIADKEPLYVLNKDVEHNSLIVGHLTEMGRSTFTVTQTNWISGETPSRDFTAEVKIRYKAQKGTGSVIMLEGGNFQFESDRVLRDITPGQIAAVYLNHICLGAGIIK
jgi:tRNA-specific 2-thiouridylase